MASEVDLSVEIGSWLTDQAARRTTCVTVRAARPVKGLVIRSSDGEARLSDNYLDIMPGDERSIDCWTEGGTSDIEWRCASEWTSLIRKLKIVSARRSW